MRLAFVLLILALTGCQSAMEGYLIAEDSAMATEARNGAIVRLEMIARGEMPWSSWPWAGRP